MGRGTARCPVTRRRPQRAVPFRALRTVRDFQYTLSCVSLLGMKKTGAKLAGFTHARRYTPCPSLSAARSYGHTPRKLPRFSEQSPASSLAPTQALDYCTTKPLLKSSYFSLDFFSFFNGFPPPTRSCACTFCPAQVLRLLFAASRAFPLDYVLRLEHNHSIHILQRGVFS